MGTMIHSSGVTVCPIIESTSLGENRSHSYSELRPNELSPDNPAIMNVEPRHAYVYGLIEVFLWGKLLSH